MSSEDSTSILSAYKEPAINALTFIAPPAALAIRQWKADLDARHLAISLALYCSFILYVPAILHAYWYLNIREQGGFEVWGKDKKEQVYALWRAHGGVYEDAAANYYNQARAYIDEKKAAIASLVDTLYQYKDQLVAYLEELRRFVAEKWARAMEIKEQTTLSIAKWHASIKELWEDAVEAYETGHLGEWIKEHAVVAFEQVKNAITSFPRLQAVLVYLEARIPALIDWIKNILTPLTSKLGQE